MRLFVAVSLPEVIVEESRRILEILKKEDLFANWVPPENMHITILYLGETEDVEAVKESLSKVLLTPFFANLTKAGVFSPDFIRVVWLGAKARQFDTLHVKVCEALNRNFKKDFVAHITLARVKSVRDKRAFIQKLNMLPVKPIEWKVDSFVLMSSTLTPGGPVYEEIERFKF